MAEKASIYLDDDTLALIEAERKVGETNSAVIRRLVERGSNYVVITTKELRRKDGSR